MEYDFQGALQAGVAPSAIVDALKAKGFAGYDFDGARQAGVQDEQIVQALMARSSKDTSFGSAFTQGLAQPLQALGTTAQVMGAPGVGKALTSAGQAVAPTNYENATQAFLNEGGEGYSWGHLPRAAVEQSGQFAGSLLSRAAGAAVGGAVGGPAGAVAGGFLAPTAFGALQVVGDTAMERAKAHGRTEPNEEDMRAAYATALASGALEGVGANLPGVSRVFSRGLGTAAGHTATAMAGELGTESLQSVAEQTGKTLGTPGGLRIDPKQALGEGLIGAGAGGSVHVAGHTVGAVGGAIQDIRNNRAAGPNVRAFADEMAASQEASQMTGEQVPPPTFDKLSPAAQNGAAELAALEFYNQRRKTESEGMGRESTRDPSDTFKGVMDDVHRNVEEIGRLMESQGVLDSQQVKDLMGAVSEAKRHNRAAGEDGSRVSYFDTLRDRVAQLPLPEGDRATLLMNLRVLDIAADNSLKRNAQGFLERHAGLIGGVAGVGLSAAFPGAGLAGAAAGGVAGAASRAVTRAAARALDRQMGNQLPPLLRNEQSIRAFADKHGLQPGTTAQDLMALRQRLQATQAERASGDAAFDAKIAETATQTSSGWAFGIARELGLRERDVHAAVQLLFPERDARALLERNTIPTATMHRVTRLLRDTMEDGTLGPLGPARTDAPAGGTTVGGNRTHIRNPQAYQGAIDNALAAQQTIREQHPDLAPHVDTISTITKRSERLAEVQRIAGATPGAAAKARVETVLGPLAGFGERAARVTPSAGPGPSRGFQRAPGPMGMGADITARARTRAEAGQVRSDRRFKRDGVAPGEQSTVSAPPLEGLPRRVKASDGSVIEAGPNLEARAIAESYMREAGLPYNPPKTYARVDPERARRIAQAFEEMQHAPSDPLVKAAYDKMIAETVAQYQAIVRTGVEFTFMPTGPDGTVIDPYEKTGPRGAVEDINRNRRMQVYPTSDGFGSGDPAAVADNPLLAVVPGIEWNGRPVQANDLFRAVHDYFGHAKEGVGFRADGEENAWRSHAAMYSPLARRAMTTETRGQNSWLNYGPNGEANQTAKTGDTVFAEQKIGLLPDWVTEDAVHDAPTEAFDRIMADAKAKAMQDRARELLATKGKPTKAEATVLIHDPMDSLERGEVATKRGRYGVDVAEAELLPNRKLPTIDWQAEGSAKAVADLMTKEAIHALTKNGSAVGWYDSTLKRAMGMVSAVFPEVGTDPRASGLFKGILAITSNGQNVVNNFQQTFRIYESVRGKDDFHIPDDFGWAGPTGPSMRSAAKTWNNVVDQLGPDRALEFFGTRYSVKELQRVTKEFLGGDGFKASGENMDSTVYGSAVLGPKIGNGFFSNLMGRFDMPTMDRWFMRTISRLTGNMVARDTPEALAARLGKVQTALAAMDPQEAAAEFKLDPKVLADALEGDEKSLIAVGTAVAKIDEKQRFPRPGKGRGDVSVESGEVRKASKLVPDATRGAMVMAPFNGKHRVWLRDVVARTQANLRKGGIDINAADLQALIWFPEQRYWQQKLGVGSAKTDADYENGAVAALINLGKENEALQVYERFGYNPMEAQNRLESSRDIARKLMKEKGPADAEE